MEEIKKIKEVVVVILIAVALLVVAYFIGLPLLQQYLANKSCEKTYGPGWKAVKNEDYSDNNSTQAAHRDWLCLRKEEYNKIMENKNE